MDPEVAIGELQVLDNNATEMNTSQTESMQPLVHEDEIEQSTLYANANAEDDSFDIFSEMDHIFQLSDDFQSQSWSQNGYSEEECVTSVRLEPQLPISHNFLPSEFPCSIPEEEEDYLHHNSESDESGEEISNHNRDHGRHYNDDTVPLSTLASPNYPASRWKFTDIDSPTSMPGPFPPEQQSAAERRLSDSFSVSQVSADSNIMNNNEFYQGGYGWLPDQRHAHSASQISVAGTGSQIGLVDSYMQNASQRSVHTHRRRRHRKKEKKPAIQDTKTVDSGIGQSLSGGKSLTPKHGVSLTQGPRETHLTQSKPHHSMDHGIDAIAGKINRHWSFTHTGAVVCKPKTKANAENHWQSHKQIQHHSSQHGSFTLPRSLQRKAQTKISKGRETQSTSPQGKPALTRKETFPSKTETFQTLQGVKELECMLPNDEQKPLIVPDGVQPTATLENCTSAGRVYEDKINGFALSIPQRAIAEGESLTIDIGVAMYGPFAYPQGLRRVSPVFWMCVRGDESYQFKKPVKISIQHFLNIKAETDVSAMKLGFVKANHSINREKEHIFYRVEDIQGFKPRTHYGTILTYHFCYQCIVANISKETIQNTIFCLFGTVPNTFVYDRTMYVFFYVTFCLNKCLDTVRRQIAMSDELSYCEYSETKTKFQFAEIGPSAAITIHTPHSLPGGWQLGIEFNHKVATF